MSTGLFQPDQGYGTEVEAVDQMFRPLSKSWLEKIALAKKFKTPFDDIADQCTAFFAGACGFMWDDIFRQKFLNLNSTPRFRITMQKAFELVAIFGPMLYWRNPHRSVKPRRRYQIDPQMLAAIQDPVAMQLAQMEQQEAQVTEVQRNIRAQLLSGWLNYTPDEQPYGLAWHAQMAIVEALVKGRGCLWVEPYKMPGGRTNLTGAFWYSVDDLLIDPDARTLQEAKWIARRCVHPAWEVERMYGLRPGSLEGKGQYESAESQADAFDDLKGLHREEGRTFDLVVYYKVWSKGGTGTRFAGNRNYGLRELLDKVTGDYVYLVIAPDVDYPLNLPVEHLRPHLDQATGQVRPGLTMEEVSQRLAWPVPYWMDREWPVCCLDFYPRYDNPWPIAPLAPALGELTFLNVFISHLANRIWTSSRDFIAVLRSAEKEVREAIESGKDQAIIPLTEVHSDINRVVQFLQQPQTNFDVWKIIDSVLDLFEKRTGLNELVYGNQKTQDRSALATQTKREQISIRPDHMAQEVERWMTRIARLEKLCVRQFVKAKDVWPLFGQTGAYLWQRFIDSQPVEIILRDVDVTIQAGQVRKPNKARDAQNVQTILPILAPELSKHADMTFDTRPLNALIARLGDAIDMDMRGLFMGPRQPQPPQPPPPEIQQQQQQMAQMQMQAQQMDIQSKIIKSRLDAQKAQLQMQALQQKAIAEQRKAQVDIAKTQADLQADLLETRLEIAAKKAEMMMGAQKNAMELQQEREKHELEMAREAAEAMFPFNVNPKSNAKSERSGD